MYFSGKQSGISSESLGSNHAQELATGWFDPIFPRWVFREDHKNWFGLVISRNVSLTGIESDMKNVDALVRVRW